MKVKIGQVYEGKNCCCNTRVIIDVYDNGYCEYRHLWEEEGEQSCEYDIKRNGIPPSRSFPSVCQINTLRSRFVLRTKDIIKERERELKKKQREERKEYNRAIKKYSVGDVFYSVFVNQNEVIESENVIVEISENKEPVVIDFGWAKMRESLEEMKRFHKTLRDATRSEIKRVRNNWRNVVEKERKCKQELKNNPKDESLRYRLNSESETKKRLKNHIGILKEHLEKIGE